MIKNGPWTIKESIEKYKNKWMTVVEYQVIRPDGEDGIFGVIKMISGVSVLPFDKDGNIILTKEFRFALGKESVEAVSGGVESGERSLEAAKRELLEETGLKAEKWTSLGEVHPFTSMVYSSAELFIAEDLFDTGERHLEGTEEIELLKMSFEEVLQMVLHGEIVHAPTCVLVLKANEYLKNRKGI